jgi:MinD superfamily P-loop ATPase
MLDDSWTLPEFKDELCIRCGSCVETCEQGAIVLGEEHAFLAHPEDCDGCGECEDVCPQGGIQFTFEIVWGEN